MPQSQHSGDRSATGAGSALDYGAGSTFGSWTMVVTQGVADSQIALETSPDNSTWTRVGVVTGLKSMSLVNAGIGARYARVNVVALGTGNTRVGAVIVPS